MSRSRLASRVAALKEGMVPALSAAHSDRSSVMRDDGRLAVVALDGECLWSSPTGGNPGAFAQLHEDGQLVIHSCYRDVLWSSSDLA